MSSRADTAPQPTTADAGAIRSRRATSGLVIVVLLGYGALKLAPADVVIAAGEQLGIPAELARLVGAVSLLSTTLAMIPQTAMLRGGLLSAYLGGGLCTLLRIGTPPLGHSLLGISLGGVVWVGLWLRALMPIGC